MADKKLAAVILAAGEAKRTGGRAKMLWTVGGRTLIASVIGAAREAGASRIVCVLGHRSEKVAATLPAGIEIVEQRERLGTGHAAMQAEPLLAGFPGELLVLYGDKPLLRSGTLRKLVELVRSEEAAAAMLTFDAPPGGSYGRIVRDRDGRVLRIVETGDASPAELAGREANGGTYCFLAGELFGQLHRLTRRNVQGEYYLTDVIGLLTAERRRVAALRAADPDELLGVNTAQELAAARAAVKRRGVLAERA